MSVFDFNISGIIFNIFKISAVMQRLITMQTPCLLPKMDRLFLRICLVECLKVIVLFLFSFSRKLLAMVSTLTKAIFDLPTPNRFQKVFFIIFLSKKIRLRIQRSKIPKKILYRTSGFSGHFMG